MSFGRHAFGLSVVVSLCTATTHAQDTPLTLAEVLARAREQAPQVVVARLAIDEARARVVGAAQRFQSNPDLDVSAGNRTGGEGRSTDFEIGVGQMLERCDRRAARRAAAAAAVGQTTATADDVRRLVLQAAAGAYYRVIHVTERARILRLAQQLSEEIEAVAQRRFRAGDVAVLDAHVARAASARARAAVEAADAMRVDALGDLNQLLGTEGATVQGALADGLRDVDVPTLMASAEQRPDLGVIAQAIEEAVAEGQQARTFQRPQYGVGARYAREERDQIVIGAFTVTLPVFAKGQEAHAAAAARAAWRRAELDAARRRVRVEVHTASEVYLRRAAAASALEEQALSSVDENERLAARSFEVGQLGLADSRARARERTASAGSHSLGPESVFRPADLKQAVRDAGGLPDQPIPQICVLDFDVGLSDGLARDGVVTPMQSRACFHTQMLGVTLGGVRCGVVPRTIGGPHTALIAEQLQTSGAEVILGITSAGRVSPPAHGPPAKADGTLR